MLIWTPTLFLSQPHAHLHLKHFQVQYGILLTALIAVFICSRYRAEHQLILFTRAAVSQSWQTRQLDEGRADKLGAILVS